MRLCVTLFVLCLTSLPSLALATVPEDPVFGVQVSSGAAVFLGSLAEGEVSPFLDLQIEALFLRADTLPLLGYVAFEGLWMQTTQRGTAWPFGQGEEVSVLAFLFIPTLCAQAGGHVLFCGGIGQGTVNVNGEGEERDYGTWNYQASVKVFPTEQVSLSLVGKYVGRVEQRMASQYRYFTFLSAGLGAGWVW